MDTVPVCFQFRVGQLVRYEGTAWTITQRWYYEGVVSSYVRYGLGNCAGRATAAYEPDLSAVEEEGLQPP